MRTTASGDIPVEKRYSVYINDANGNARHWYYTDCFDDIDEKHKPLCRLLDAAREYSMARIPGIGTAQYYGNHCQPTYDLEIAACPL